MVFSCYFILLVSPGKYSRKVVSSLNLQCKHSDDFYTAFFIYWSDQSTLPILAYGKDNKKKLFAQPGLSVRALWTSAILSQCCPSTYFTMLELFRQLYDEGVYRMQISKQRQDNQQKPSSQQFMPKVTEQYICSQSQMQQYCSEALQMVSEDYISKYLWCVSLRLAYSEYDCFTPYSISLSILSNIIIILFRIYPSSYYRLQKKQGFKLQAYCFLRSDYYKCPKDASHRESRQSILLLLLSNSVAYWSSRYAIRQNPALILEAALAAAPDTQKKTDN